LERLTDKTILAMSRQILLRRDAAILLRHCHLAIALRDGETITERVDIPAGQPDFFECAAGATGRQIDRLIETVAGLETAPDIRGLMVAASGRG